LQITKYYYPSISFGGPVQCTHNISINMVKKGHEVTVFTTDAYEINSRLNIKDRFKLVDGVKVFFFHNIVRMRNGFFISPKMIGILREEACKYDIVHLHEYRTFQNIVFYFLRKKHTPYVLSLHGELTYPKQSLMMGIQRFFFDSIIGNKLLNQATRILALTEFEKSQLVNKGISAKKIVIIPNAIDPQNFEEVPLKNHFRMQFNLNNDIIILFIGRLNHLKGLDNLIQGFSLLSSNQNIKLVLAGPDDGMLESLQNLVSRLNLKDRVVFTGSLDRKQVLAAINEAAVVVYASKQEGFPLVPLEAAIMGKPVIVSNHPSMSFVKKGNFGLIIEYGNTIKLKEALETILNDSVLSMKLGENGRKFVKENFTWNVVSSRIEKVYSEILNQKNGRRFSATYEFRLY
jgi:glycosyltransferase involved in cell wall biosynthesis